MPRSFLVKRGGLHHLRHVARSPSPGATAVMFSELEKRAGAWDASLEYTKPKTNGDNAIAAVLLQQDLKFCNGNGSRHPFSPQSYGGWQRLLFVLALLRLNFTLLNVISSSSVWSDKRTRTQLFFPVLIKEKKTYFSYFSKTVCLLFFSDHSSAEACSPVNANIFSQVEKVVSQPPKPEVLSSLQVRSGYPDKLSGLRELEHHQILRETRSSSCSKISAPRQECLLCGKVTPIFFMKFLFLFHFDFLF